MSAVAAGAAQAGGVHHAEQVLFFVLLQLTVVVLAGRAGSALARRFGQSTAVGEIVMGILLGPSLFGWLAPGLFQYVFKSAPPEPMQVLSHSPVICRGQPDAADVTWYSHPTGAGVFTAGTLAWGDAMTSADPTVRRVITTATERVLRELAQPRAGARLPAVDNVARYYTTQGALRGSGPASTPSARDDQVDPNADDPD